MKKAFSCLAVLMFVPLMCSSLLAWEFSLRGETEWRYRYVSRTGPNDLFGNAHVAQHAPGNGTSIGLAGPLMQPPSPLFPGENASPGVQIEVYSSKGADGSYAQERLTLYPQVTINPAISLRSIIGFQGNLNGPYIGGSNWATNPFYSGWVMVDSRDFVTGMGLTAPIVEAFWVKAQLPWATLMIGQRPAGFGMGWLMHENDVYARSLSLLMPYGPLTFVFSQYLQDQLFAFTDPNDQRNTNGTAYTVATSTDKNQTAVFSQSYALTYRSSNLDTGAMVRIIKTPAMHALAQPGNTYRDDITNSKFAVSFLDSHHLNDQIMPIYGEGFFLLGASYLKYTNGRFFINGEYDFQIVEWRRNGGRPISGAPQAWAAEAGFLAGPIKVSLAHFYRSGHDRRGGRFNTTLATGHFGGNVFVSDKWNHFLSWWGGGETPMQPYNYLLGLYGAGNNSYNAAGKTTFEDFLAFAGRVDYAAAANLNLFASIIKAYRASNTATSLGLYDGAHVIGPDLPTPNQDPNNGITPVPNATNTDLGWEADIGMNWKLLEGLSFNFLFAYWQPGGWFREAYRDMTLSNPATNPAPDRFPNGVINTRRPIDALIGVQTGLFIEF